MKKFLPTLLVACALAIPSAITAATFEGNVTMQISVSGKTDAPQEMQYRLKDGLVRVDMQVKDRSGKPGMTIGTILDPKKQEMTVLMPQQQMYMVNSLAPRPGQPAPQASADKMSDAKLEKTGETETILGYKCDKYILKTDKSTMSMWLTSELGSFMSVPAGGGFGGARSAPAQAQAWEKALEGKSAFPMRVVGAAPDGKENFRLEVTAVEKKSLPASDFVPPAGWKKFEMPNMGDMMKGVIPGMGR